jgi:thiosulfate dehydrogenase
MTGVRTQPLALFALAAMLCVAVAGCHSHRSATAANQGAGAANASDTMPAQVQRGKLIFDETPKYAQKYTGNRLSCGDCHLASGTSAFSAPMIDMAGLFPMFNKRAGHIISLQNRIQECFARSEAGEPPPENSAEMHELVAYIDWLSRNGAKGKAYKGRGFVKLPALKGNPTAGKAIYAAQCSACHGIDGAGVPPVLPALWGKNSYNDGAGMNDPAKTAPFVIFNMPQNHPGTLTPQQAYDVAAYIHTKPRPKFNQAYKGY